MSAPEKPDVLQTGSRDPDASSMATVETARGASLPHACAPEPAEDVASRPVPFWRRPRQPRSRLLGIDAARGIALLGMMSVHTIAATTAEGELSLAWSLAAGKSAALFALLAGVGVAFASGGRRRPRGQQKRAHAAALLSRALMIGTVGLMLGYVVATDDAAVILPYYAVLFVLAVPLLSLSIRTLVVLATLLTVVTPALSHLWRAGTELVTVPNPTFTDLVLDPFQLLHELTLTGTFPALQWIAYLCAGLAVGRAALSSRLTAVVVTLTGLALVVVSRLVSWLLLDVLGGLDKLEEVALRSMTSEDFAAVLREGPTGITPTDSPWWLATMAPHSGTPLDIAHTIGTSLIVLGVALLVGRTTTALLRPLAALGSMSLTLYSGHLLLLSWSIVPGGPRGLVIHTAVLLVFALVWGRFFTRGPLEDLVAQVSSAVRRKVLAAPPGEPSGVPEKA